MPPLSPTGLVLAAALALTPRPAHAQTQSPHEEVELACSACHTTSGWNEIRFDHDSTGFALAGRHADQACLDCHRVENFSLADADCASCHADYHRGALGEDCASCHAEDAWRPSTFVHDAAAFPLWGAHEAVSCSGCHADQATFQFLEPAQTCFDCHADDFANVRAAVHLRAGPDCETCHTQDHWSGGHDPAAIEIRYGPHEVSCGRCHKRGEDYTSYTCADCHKFPLREPEHRGLDPDDARCMDCHGRGDFDD